MISNAPSGRFPATLAETADLLHRDPALAETRAREFLKSSPGHPVGRLLFAAALRVQRKADAALAILEPLVAENPGLAGAQYELGMTLAALGRVPEATHTLSRVLEAVPNLPGAWRALGDLHFLAGNLSAADEAYGRHVRAPVYEPALHEALDALRGGDFGHARNLLQDHLARYPTDVVALRARAEVASRSGDLKEAEALLARCLERMPSFAVARWEYAMVLRQKQKPVEAVKQVNLLLDGDPRNHEYRKLKASALAHIGEYDEAIACYTEVLKDQPDNAIVWTFRAHFLRAMGRTDEAIAGYRKSIELRPQHGDAYWSLANLKTFRFSPADVEAMRAQLARHELSDTDRIPMYFALGCALENMAAYEEAFQTYAKGNEFRNASIPYKADNTTLPRSKALFTPEFFRERAGTGNPAADPIFVVGMPRAGSTLVDQILSSHSAVEGTMELLEILVFAERLGGAAGTTRASVYPEILSTLTPAALMALGDEYLERTRVQRKRGTPFFIDKTPNNFLHIGFIQLILPNAKIVDVRRHPLACCFSNFKQHFAQGQHFAYSLTDLGHFYSKYVELMAHYDTVLPGKVHRVFYEDLVENSQVEIKRLLAYCGLPFEEACLRFYENARPVLTPSSEQVRQPIFTEGLDQWRHFEPWLGPLKTALGPALEAYPGVPKY